MSSNVSVRRKTKPWGFRALRNMAKSAAGRRKFIKRKKNGKRRTKSGLTKTTFRKLYNKKDDTLIERVCKRIAVREINKSIVKLIMRRFLFGDYTKATNLFTIPADVGGFAPNAVYFDRPLIACISQIPLQNIQQTDITATTDITETRVIDESTIQAGTGGKIGIAITTDHGKRRGDSVKISSIVVRVRALLRENSDQTEISLTHMKCQIIRIEDDFSSGVADPTDYEIIPYAPWGYSKILDKTESFTQSAVDFKHKICASAWITFRQHDANCCTKIINLIYKPKRQNLLQFAPGDQHGKLPIRYKYFVAFRSNIPKSLQASNVHPYIWVCSKINYTDG